jgi:hypothetical protein
MAEVALNLWDADLYGDGSGGRGIKLTAYQIDEDLAVNSSVFISVNLTKDDLPKRYVVDDEWAYPGSKKFTKWMQLFIAKQLERKTK